MMLDEQRILQAMPTPAQTAPVPESVDHCNARSPSAEKQGGLLVAFSRYSIELTDRTRDAHADDIAAAQCTGSCQNSSAVTATMRTSWGNPLSQLRIASHASNPEMPGM